MNFTLHSTTGPSSATLPPGPQDLPRLQRPARRRLSPGKVMASGLAVAGRDRRGRRLQRSRHEQADQGPLHQRQQRRHHLPSSGQGRCRSRWSRRAALESSEEPRRLLPGRGADHDHHDQARGNAGQEGRDRLRARLGVAAGSARPIRRSRPRAPRPTYENAKLTREVAEIAVIEYVEGIFKQDQATVEGEIKLAESDLSRSEDRLDWAQRMFEKGYVSMAQKVSEELTLKKARFALEQAQSKQQGPRRLHQGEDDQGARERGREGPLGRAGQEGDLGAGKEQGKEAREADRQLQDQGPRRRDRRLRQRSRTGPSAAASPRSRKGRRSASGRRSSACPTSPGCRSTPRSTSRRSTRSART